MTVAVDSWQSVHRAEMLAARVGLLALARDAWGDLVRDAMDWHLIVNAGTYDTRELARRRRAFGPVEEPMITREANKRRISRFLEGMRVVLDRPAEGFGACEVGDAGALEHWHGLLSFHGGLLQGDVTALSEWWRTVPGNGFIRLEIPRSADWFARYVSKHTVKQLGDVVFSNGCGRLSYR